MSAREPMTAALERLRADIHARWTARLTPALNTPTKEDLLSFMGEVDEAFTAALAASPAPDPRTWQPIETAPKDGTLLLLWSCGYREVGLWVQSESQWMERGEEYTLTPTHWMTLPDPPVQP